MKSLCVIARAILAYESLFGCIAFFVVPIALLSWAATYKRPASEIPQGNDLGVIRHLIHHSLRLSEPRKAHSTVRVDPEGLLPGDVLAFSKSNGDYGYFTHITGMLNSTDALGQNVAYGIFRTPVTTLDGYDHIRVLRADLHPAQRLAVSKYMHGLIGSVFQLMAHKLDRRLWNCTKSVWAAYRSIGIDLVPHRNFIVPDDIANSPALHVVREWKGL